MEEGLEGYEFGELSDSLTSSGLWKPDEPSDALAMRRMTDDIQQLLLARECNIDEVALAATETQ